MSEVNIETFVAIGNMTTRTRQVDSEMREEKSKAKQFIEKKFSFLQKKCLKDFQYHLQNTTFVYLGENY